MKRIIQWGVGAVLCLAATTTRAQQSPDSLNHYLEQAARNNPQVNSDFMLYKAALEKVPQAGAFADPELEVGVLARPMETLMGKQVADFTLMQMFPWFGTRKAARSEATEMARMAYEKFRDTRDNLWYEVKAQWYRLVNLNEQYRNTADNIRLLRQLEQLALNRFTASPLQGSGNPMSSGTNSSPAAGSDMSLPASGNGMAGMGGMGSKGSTVAPAASVAPSGNMSGMGTSTMSAAAGGMSDVLRIQMERAELEDNLKNLASLRRAAEAGFNALLNRPSDSALSVPDSLQPHAFRPEEQAQLDTLFARNPMLTMIDAEADSYRAKARMDRRMSYPMIGIGLQYSLFNKSDNSMLMAGMNGKDMVMPMVKVSLPLFRRKYSAQQRETQNNLLASELKRENTLNQLQTQYISILQQLEDAERKMKLYERQCELSAATWQLITGEFTAGRQSLTDVIQVERQMLDYRLKRSEAVADYNTRIAAIEKLLSNNPINKEEK